MRPISTLPLEPCPALRRLLLLLFVCAVTAPAPADHWPGWRGRGDGISAETDVVHEWGPDENILWSARIEGDGLSSPIVWGDRVYLTTAVEGSETSAIHLAATALAFGLLALALLAAWRRRRRRGEPPGGALAPWWYRAAHRMDRAAAVAWTLVFFTGLAFCLLRRDQVIVPYEEHFGWLKIRNVALYGGLAAMFWIDKRSWWRLLVAALVIAALLVSARLAPLDSYTMPVPISGRLPKRVILMIGVSVGWCLVLLAIARRSAVRDPGTGGSLWWRGIGPATLLAVAAVLYVLDPLLIHPLRLVVAAGIAVVAVAWFAAAARSLLPPPARTRPSLGPAALIAAALVLFIDVNYADAWTGSQRRVVCIDRDTGEVHWDRIGFRAPDTRKWPTNSYATPTPCTNGECIVADFGPGLVCMDLDGTVRWRVMERHYAEYLRYGASASPVIFEDSVIHTYMGERPRAKDTGVSYLRALDLATGQERWRVTPPGAYSAYDTPLIREIGGRAMLLFTTFTHTVAYDARTGEERWTLPTPSRQIIPSVVADDDTVYVVGGTHLGRAAIAIPLTPEGDLTDAGFAWKVEAENLPDGASPLVDDGLLYWISAGGIGVCVDAETGEQRWKKRIEGEYMASPVAVDGKILFAAESGDVTVIETGPEFRVLARNSIGLDEQMLASPAISAGRIFLRTRQHLLCVGRTP